MDYSKTLNQIINMDLIKKLNFKLGLATWLKDQEDIVDITEQIELLDEIKVDLREEEQRQIKA